MQRTTDKQENEIKSEKFPELIQKLENIVSETECEKKIKAQKIKQLIHEFSQIFENTQDDSAKIYAKENIFLCLALSIGLNLNQDLTTVRKCWKDFIFNLVNENKILTWSEGFSYIVNEFLRPYVQQFLRMVEQHGIISGQNYEDSLNRFSAINNAFYDLDCEVTRCKGYIIFKKCISVYRNIIELPIKINSSPIELNHLNEAIGHYQQIANLYPNEDYPEPTYIKHKIIECFVLAVSIKCKYDLNEQRQLWSDCIQQFNLKAQETEERLTWEFGFDYLINQFIKKYWDVFISLQKSNQTQVNKTKELALVGVDAIISLMDTLMKPLKEIDGYQNFHKKVMLYQKLLSPKKDEISKHQNSNVCLLNTEFVIHNAEKSQDTSKLKVQEDIKIEENIELDLETLKELSSKNASAIAATKISLRVLIGKCIEEMQSQPGSKYLNAFLITRYVSAYIICGMYKQCSEDHQQNLIKSYINSKIHQYIKNIIDNKNNNAANKYTQGRRNPEERKKAEEYKQMMMELDTDLYKVLTSCITEIFTRSFPMVENLKAIFIVNEIQDHLKEIIVHYDIENKLLNNIKNQIAVTFGLFQLSYSKMHKHYDKYKNFDSVETDETQLLKIARSLEVDVNDMSSKKCVILCAEMYSAIAEIYCVLNSNFKNELYRNKAIQNFIKVKEYITLFSPPIALLYCAQINIFEIHTDLQKYINNINKEVIFLMKLKNDKNKKQKIEEFNRSIYSNIVEFLQHIVGKQLCNNGPKTKPYDNNQTFFENIAKGTGDVVQLLLSKGHEDKAIHCCCALLQLLDATELKNLPGFAKLMTSELFELKMSAFRVLYKREKYKSISIFKANHLYLTGALYLKDSPKLYNCANDKYLSHAIFALIEDNEKRENKEMFSDYIEKGLYLLPNNFMLNQKKGLIAINAFVNQISVLKQREVLENNKEINPSAMLWEFKIQSRKIPTVLEKMSGTKSINDEYKKSCSIHSEIEKKAKLIANNHDKIQKIIGNYLEKSLKLDEYIELYDSTFTELVFEQCQNSEFDIGKTVYTNDESDLLQMSLEKTMQTHPIFKELTEIFDSYQKLYQTIKADINQYEKLMDSYESSKKRTRSLFDEMNLKSKLAEEKAKKIQKEKARKVEEENARKAEEEKARKLEVETRRMAELEKQKAETERTRQAEEKRQAAVEKAKKDEEEKRKLEAELAKIAEEEKSRLEIENKKRIEEEKRKIEEEKVRAEELLRDNILLNGAGISISQNVLNILSELDEKLRKIGSSLIFKSSLTAKFSIFYYNSDSSKAHQFPVNDIDIQIPFNESVKINEIISILQHFKFIGFKTRDNSYKQFTMNIDEVTIELTLVIDKTYCSNEFLILRMGKMQFANDISKIELNSQQNADKILVKASSHEFIITLPDEYKYEYINACKSYGFALLKPDPKFRSYLYGIYKYSDKLNLIPFASELKLNSNTKSLTNVIFYHELYNELVTYFNCELKIINTSCYLELKEFIKKGIHPESTHLVFPLIKAFFYALIQNGEFNYYRELTHEEISSISNNCTEQFIKRCEELSLDKNISYDIQNEVKGIATSSINVFYLTQDQYMLNNNVQQYNVYFANQINVYLNTNTLHNQHDRDALIMPEQTYHKSQNVRKQKNKHHDKNENKFTPKIIKQQNNTSLNGQTQYSNHHSFYKPKNSENIGQLTVDNQQQNVNERRPKHARNQGYQKMQYQEVYRKKNG